MSSDDPVLQQSIQNGTTSIDDYTHQSHHCRYQYSTTSASLRNEQTFRKHTDESTGDNESETRERSAREVQLHVSIGTWLIFDKRYLSLSLSNKEDLCSSRSPVMFVVLLSCSRKTKFLCDWILIVNKDQLFVSKWTSFNCPTTAIVLHEVLRSLVQWKREWSGCSMILPVLSRRIWFDETKYQNGFIQFVTQNKVKFLFRYVLKTWCPPCCSCSIDQQLKRAACCSPLKPSCWIPSTSAFRWLVSMGLHFLSPEENHLLSDGCLRNPEGSPWKELRGSRSWSVRWNQWDSSRTPSNPFRCHDHHLLQSMIRSVHCCHHRRGSRWCSLFHCWTSRWPSNESWRLERWRQSATKWRTRLVSDSSFWSCVRHVDVHREKYRNENLLLRRRCPFPLSRDERIKDNVEKVAVPLRWSPTSTRVKLIPMLSAACRGASSPHVDFHSMRKSHFVPRFYHLIIPLDRHVWLNELQLIRSDFTLMPSLSLALQPGEELQWRERNWKYDELLIWFCLDGDRRRRRRIRWPNRAGGRRGELISLDRISQYWRWCRMGTVFICWHISSFVRLLMKLNSSTNHFNEILSTVAPPRREHYSSLYLEHVWWLNHWRQKTNHLLLAD